MYAWIQTVVDGIVNDILVYLTVFCIALVASGVSFVLTKVDKWLLGGLMAKWLSGYEDVFLTIFFILSMLFIFSIAFSDVLFSLGFISKDIFLWTKTIE